MMSTTVTLNPFGPGSTSPSPECGRAFAKSISSAASSSCERPGGRSSHHRGSDFAVETDKGWSVMQVGSYCWTRLNWLVITARCRGLAPTRKLARWLGRVDSESYPGIDSGWFCKQEASSRRSWAKRKARMMPQKRHHGCFHATDRKWLPDVKPEYAFSGGRLRR